MTERFSIDQVIADLQAFVDTFPTKQEAADALGVGRLFLWRVLNKQRNPTDTILKNIGYRKEREIKYYYIKEKTNAKTEEHA